MNDKRAEYEALAAQYEANVQKYRETHPFAVVLWDLASDLGGGVIIGPFPNHAAAEQRAEALREAAKGLGPHCRPAVRVLGVLPPGDGDAEDDLVAVWG